MNYQLLSVRIVSIIGVTLFGFGLYLTFSVPDWLEEYAAEYIEDRLGADIDRKVDAVQPPSVEGRIGDFARSIYAANETRIEETKALLRDKAHEALAASLAVIRDLDCECRRLTAERIREGLVLNISMLEDANAKLISSLQAGYLNIATELKRDFRIFTATNMLVFLLLLFASLTKPQARTHFLVPTALLTTSTVICSYFYLFEQDWLLTVVYSNYVGFGYLVYLLVVALFLADIVLNRARVTSALINALSSLFSAMPSVSPC